MKHVGVGIGDSMEPTIHSGAVFIWHRIKEKEIKIYDKEDGKLRFSIDWSPKIFPEAEFFHPMKAIPDAMNWQTSTKDFTLQSIQDLFDGSYEQFKKSTIDMFDQFTKLNGATMETLSHFAKNLDEHLKELHNESSSDFYSFMDCYADRSYNLAFWRSETK